MNPTNAPKETQPTPTGAVRTVDQAELEMACIDLICHLEQSVATAKEVGREEHMKNAATTANNITKPINICKYTCGPRASQRKERAGELNNRITAYLCIRPSIFDTAAVDIAKKTGALIACLDGDRKYLCRGTAVLAHACSRAQYLFDGTH